MLTILCIVLGGLLLYVYLYVVNAKSRKIPEGAREAPIEQGLPIIGILYKVEKPLHHYLMKLGNNLGGLFRIMFGMREVFVLNDYKTIKMCLKNDGENFSGRWNGKLIQQITKNSGILMMDGEVWARQRSFMMMVLRDFGLGKSRTDEIVQNECQNLLEDLSLHENKVVDFSELIPVYTTNIISGFIMNKRFEREDPILTLIQNFMDETAKKQDLLQLFHLMVPWCDNSNICCKISCILSPAIKRIKKIHDFFLASIKEHEELLDLNSEGEDFMDRYLIKRAKIMQKTNSVQSFTDFQLMRMSLELFVAGSETTSTTLGWSFLFLSKHLNIQEKMHLEIKDFIGIEKMPSMNDKKSLPFTQAVMDEILRLSTVAPLAIFHRTFHDTVVDGIFIPQNSFVFPNLYASHRDKTIWEKPFEFYPEHFLKLSDEGKIHYVPREELIPFSLGKRQCLGELLARTEFFIFLVSIIQRFRVTFSSTVSEEQYQEALMGEDGLVRFSKINCFRFEKYKEDN